MRKRFEDPSYIPRTENQFIGYARYAWRNHIWIKSSYKNFKEYLSVLRPYWRKELRKLRGNLKKKIRKNPPPGAVEIYDKVISIRAQKGKRSLWKKENFEHNFQKDKTSASIYGLPNGDLLIHSKKGKRLWKKFQYKPEDI